MHLSRYSLARSLTLQYPATYPIPSRFRSATVAVASRKSFARPAANAKPPTSPSPRATLCTSLSSSGSRASLAVSASEYPRAESAPVARGTSPKVYKSNLNQDFFLITYTHRTSTPFHLPVLRQVHLKLAPLAEQKALRDDQEEALGAVHARDNVLQNAQANEKVALVQANANLIALL